MGGKILRTHTDELIEQGYLKGLELSIKQGVEKERTRMIQTFVSRRAAGSSLLHIPSHPGGSLRSCILYALFGHFQPF